MYLNDETNSKTIKDVSSYISSISPSAVEDICSKLKMREPFKTVFLLRYRDGIPIEEVASMLHVSIPTVNRRIRKIKVMLAHEIMRHSNDNLI